MDATIIEGALLVTAGLMSGVGSKALIDWLRSNKNGKAPVDKEDIEQLGESISEVKEKIDRLPCAPHGERIAALEERTRTL